MGLLSLIHICIVVDVKVFTPENSDELQPGVRTCVRVYIAQKRKISVGDKDVYKRQKKNWPLPLSRCWHNVIP